MATDNNKHWRQGAGGFGHGDQRRVVVDDAGEEVLVLRGVRSRLQPRGSRVG